MHINTDMFLWLPDSRPLDSVHDCGYVIHVETSATAYYSNAGLNCGFEFASIGTVEYYTARFSRSSP